MPRDGSNVYSPPAGTTATPNTTIESARYNAFVADVAADLNAPRPIVAGGTGASSVMAAQAALEITPIRSGIVVMWSGAVVDIPSGWLLCDGTNNTPDLRNRFVVGAGDTYAVGATGGADSVTLDATQMPAHTHTVSGTTNTTGAHTHTFGTNTSVGTGGNGNPASSSDNPNFTVTTSSAGAHSHTFSGTTSSVGSGSSHENRPPYYALAFIMKA